MGTELIVGGPETRGAPGGLARRSFTTTAAMGLSHGLQLASSLILVSSLGATLFSQVGLARAVVVLAIFLGELGYGPYFAREVALRPEKTWVAEWQYSLFHRFIVLSGAAVALLVSWRLAFASQSAGTAFLIYATPGTLLSAFGQSSLLYGWRRSNAAVVAQPVLWGANLAGNLLTIYLAPRALVPSLLGLSFSAGYVVQTLYFMALTRRTDLYAPRFGLGTRQMRCAAGHMTGMSIIGAAYDRSTLFFIQSLAPSFMAAYLIIDQVLNGLNTLLAQMQRLLIPDLALSAAADPTKFFENVRRVAQPLLSSAYMGLISCIFFFTFIGRLHGGLALYLAPGVLLVLDWYVRAGASIATPAILAFRQEAFLFRLLWIGCSTALALQLLVVHFGNLPLVLAIRLTNGVLVFIALSKKLGGSTVSVLAAAAGVAVAVGAAVIYDHSPLLGLGFAFAACCASASLGGRQLLRRTRLMQGWRRGSASNAQDVLSD